MYKLSYVVETVPPVLKLYYILNFGHLLRHNNRVVISNLLLPHGVVIESAIVFVAVSVDRAE